MTRLREAYATRNREEVFRAVLPALEGRDGPADRARQAEAAGLSPAHFKVEVFRLRRRFAGALQAEISETVGPTEDIGDEVRYLLSVLAGTAG